jgi:urease accessory protein
VPIELQPDHLKIEPDHVLADLLRAMHLEVAAVNEPFEPEAGAYGQHAGHGHSHAPQAQTDHSHDHDHDNHDHSHHAAGSHEHG